MVKTNGPLKRCVAAVAKGLVAGVLTGAEKFPAIAVCRPFQGRKFCSLMAAIAEGLFFGLTAGAPPVVFSGFNCDRNWLMSGNNG
jgi:hypothetical protein